MTTATDEVAKMLSAPRRATTSLLRHAHLPEAPLMRPVRSSFDRRRRQFTFGPVPSLCTTVNPSFIDDRRDTIVIAYQ